MQNKNTRSTLSKLLKYIASFRLYLVFSIVLAAVTVILQLYVPMLFGDAIDRIVAEGRVELAAVVSYLVRILVAVAVSSFAAYGMNLINNRMTYRVVEELRSKAIRHIQHLPLSYLDAHSTGDIVSRVISDTATLSDGLLLGFTQLFSGVVTILVTLIFMFSKNIWISFLVMLLTPLSFGVAKFVSSHSYHMFRKQSEVRGRQTSLIEEMVGGQRTVRAFGYEKTASERFAAVNAELAECSLKAVFYSSLTNPSTRFVNNIIYAGVALVGSFIIMAGNLTVGGLSVLLSYANQYMKPFNEISSVITEMQNALACAARIFELLEEPEECPEETGTLSEVRGKVDIQNVAFSYDKSRRLIEHFDLHVEPGMRVAVVGPTGCGKTTFINLLMRFYDTDEGDIRIDGVSIRSLSRHGLRNLFGMVLQDTWLKSGTVRENICFGKPDATEEEMVEAAKKAHSYEFIRRLPEGFDTVLTEDSISQGQKQLLCITRVMLARPPMLILDEATSNIDTRTEVQIQEAFDRLMKGRTSFVVAHRLSTIRHASLILVMRDGKIIETGTHDELLARGGFYATLYNSQFSESAQGAR